MYIVPGAPDTLISIATLVDRGYTVTFDNTAGVTISKNGITLYNKRKDLTTNLYYLDITHLYIPEEAYEEPTKAGPRALGAQSIPQKLVTKIIWLHKRMNHMSMAAMSRAVECGAWTGLDEDITPKTITAVMTHTACTACNIAKRNRLKRQQGSAIKPQQPGEVISVDYMGPITPTSARGYTGYLLYKDINSKHLHVTLTKKKPTSETFAAATKEVVEFYRAHGHSPHTLRFDAGTTENSKLTTESLRAIRIHPDPAAVNSQFQNPVEREAQTANKGVAAMLIDQQSLGPTFWDYAIEEWVQSSNATPREGQIESPLQIVTDKIPDLSSKFLFPFGCPVTTIKTEGKDHKFDTASEFGIAVGSSAGANRAVKVYVPRKGTRAVERLDVQPLRIHTPGAATEIEKQALSHEYNESEGGVTFHSAAPPTDDHLISPGTLGMKSVGMEERIGKQLRTTQAQQETEEDEPFVSEMRTRAAHRKATSDKAAILPDDNNSETGEEEESSSTELILEEPTLTSALVLAVRTIRTEANPTVTQAAKGQRWGEWMEAINAELKMLKKLECYETIRKCDVPRGKQIIPSKMDLKTKYDASGEIIKLKARLVALGNKEWKNFEADYYSPTVAQKTINLMLALATYHNMHLYGIDIYGAFITADLDDGHVYIQLPPGIAPETSEGPQVWRLKKSLYGLSRAPKAFYDSLSKFLIEHGYKRSIMDPCLMYKQYDDNNRIIFSIHVDDFAIAATKQRYIKELCDILKSKYTITESNNLESFLGVRIEQANGNLYLSQPGHIASMAKAVGITDFNAVPTVSTPIRPDFNDAYQDDSPLCSKDDYRSILGKLIFILRSRPDVAQAVNRLATRTEKATERDKEALVRVVKYLVNTRHLELVYAAKDSSAKKGIAQLLAYSDAAYLTHKDSCSHLGICFTYGDVDTGVFYARSAKQTIVTTSSTEAETYSAVEATKEVIYFRDLLTELGFTQLQPTPLYVDNKSLISLATKFSGSHKKVKHFMMRLHFLIEQVNKQVIQLHHQPDDELRADLLTKPLQPGQFQAKRLRIMGPQRHRVGKE